MKVLTLNTWQERGPWRERWELIFKNLDALQPDLILFQEIFNRGWIREISKRTGYASAVYHEAASGLALFAKYPVLNSGSLMLKTQSSREDYRRYLLYAKFQGPCGDFFAFNTHLSWMLEDGAVRETQTAEIAMLMDQIDGKSESLIGGDFNTVAWSREIRQMTGEQGFVDVYRQLEPDAPGLTWTYDNGYTREGRHALPDRRIDYLFTRHAAKTLRQPIAVRCVMTEPDAAGILASDHYGVFVEFKES